MNRPWARAVVAACVAYGFFGATGAACGSSANGTGASSTGTKDAGHKDSSASFPTGDDTLGDDAQGDATTGDDAATDAGDDGGDGDAGDDAGDDGAADGGDDAGDASATNAGTTDGGTDASEAADAADAAPVDAGDGGGPTTTPDAGSHDAGTSGDGGACNFAGTWASQLAVDVTWAAGGSFDIVIAPGSGTIKQWLLSTRTVSGTTTTDTAQLCGIELPDFAGSGLVDNETWGIRFPDTLFDSGDLSTFAIPGTVSGTTPTATYTTSSVAVLLGLTLANPTTAVWPATIATSVDEDADGKSGITAGVAQGASFSNVPLDFSVVANPNGVARSNRLYVAIRQVTSIAAHFSDCDHASGTITVPQLGTGGNKKYAIDSHVIGCGLVGSTTDCTATQASFVDSNQPVFVPSTTQFTSTRVAAGTTCATVRSTFP
jgi:hypothetical protein